MNESEKAKADLENLESKVFTIFKNQIILEIKYCVKKKQKKPYRPKRNSIK